MYVTDDVAENIKNDLRPVDRNPSIACHNCGESYNYQEYWEPRYVEGMDWNLNEVCWLCDECLEEMYEWYRRRKTEREHQTLTEFVAQTDGGNGHCVGADTDQSGDDDA
jgi:hypothetical protein